MRGVVLLALCLVVSWYGMLVTHEAGHVLHAWISGGRVERVVVPLLGFSRTDLAHNPRPVFVAWGGFVWGVVLPCVLLVLLRSARARPAAAVFAALALIGNGAYACSAVGDVEDILRAGGARWPLIGFGVLSMVAGVLVLDR
jgi:hypothetical protein